MATRCTGIMSIMADPNTAIIYGWAEQLGRPPAIPSSLKEPRNVAKFVDFVDRNVFANSKFWEFNTMERQKFFEDIAERTKIHLSDIKDYNQRINVTLRLWASCLSAAKTMHKTYVIANPDGSLHEEAYTPQMRQGTFKVIESIANKDEIYRLGVEAAPLFIKEVRGQEIFTDGIPSDSIVMKHMPNE
jgi:hypothetical protein